MTVVSRLCAATVAVLLVTGCGSSHSSTATNAGDFLHFEQATINVTNVAKNQTPGLVRCEHFKNRVRANTCFIKQLQPIEISWGQLDALVNHIDPGVPGDCHNAIAAHRADAKLLQSTEQALVMNLSQNRSRPPVATQTLMKRAAAYLGDLSGISRSCRPE